MKLEDEVNKELSGAKSERESSEKELLKNMNEFASERKGGMGDDIKETLSRSEPVGEESKKTPERGIRKFLNKIVRTCR